MIERDDEIVEILELDNRTGVTKEGEVIALDPFDMSLTTETEREYPEADSSQSTETADLTVDEIDERDEIRIEDRGDHHCGVAGVGEVIHRPGPDLKGRDGFG